MTGEKITLNVTTEGQVKTLVRLSANKASIQGEIFELKRDGKQCFIVAFQTKSETSRMLNILTGRVSSDLRWYTRLDGALSVIRRCNPEQDEVIIKRADKKLLRFITDFKRGNNVFTI